MASLATAVMHPAMVMADINGVITSANQEFCKMVGYGVTELIGQKVNILMNEPYASQHDAYMEKYKVTKQARVLGTSRAVEARHKDGSTLTIRLSVSQIESDGQIMFVAMFEILESNVVVVDMDDQGIITNVTKNVHTGFGWKRKDLIGKDMGVLMDSAQATFHATYVKQYVKLGAQSNRSKIVNHTRNLVGKNQGGELFPVSLKVEQYKTTTGKWAFRGHTTRIQEEIDGVTTINTKGIIKQVNEGFCLISGHSREELIGMNIKHLMTPPHSELHDLYLERYAKTKNARIVGKGPRQVYMKHKDGSAFLINLTVEQFSSPEGEMLFRGNINRVTQRKWLEEDDIATGTIIGLYEVEKTIGKGYFGKVKRCVHKLTNEKVAIKTLRRKQYEKISMVFPPREINLLKALHHPHICKLYDVIDDGARVYLIQEFVTGGELYDYANKKDKLNEQEARQFFRQLLSAIDYMHRMGVVHRDLKLENCLIDAFGNIKIIDFGLGNFFDGKQLLKTFCGTPAYAAPELWKTQPYIGPEVDVWSLGVMLYLMLFGYLPFADIKDVTAGKYKLDETISPDARDLISKILVSDPKKRIKVSEIGRHPWVNKGYTYLYNEDPLLKKAEMIDDEVLGQLAQYGFELDLARKSIEKREHNQITTCYFLLCGKKYRQYAEKASLAEKMTSEATVNEGTNKHTCSIF